MGIIGSALAEGLAGGVEGLGQGASQVGKQWNDQAFQEEEAQNNAMRAQTLAQLQAQLQQQTYAANQDTDIGNAGRRIVAETPAKVAEQVALAPGAVAQATAIEAAKPIPAGATVRGQNGEPDFTAPVKLTPEQRDYWEQRGDYYRSLAASGGKANQDPGPKIVPFKDSDGNVVGLIDENSGAIGTPIPAKPGTPAQSHWFSPDSPAVPPTAGDIAWTLHGKPLAGGLDEVHPKVAARAAGAGTVPASGDGVVRATADTDAQAQAQAAKLAAARRPFAIQGPNPSPASVEHLKQNPTLASVFDQTYGQGSAAAVLAGGAPATPATSPSAPAAPADPATIGLLLDSANARVAAANAKLRTYGMIQRRMDPAGFAQAQQEADQAVQARAPLLAAQDKAMMASPAWNSGGPRTYPGGTLGIPAAAPQ